MRLNVEKKEEEVFTFAELDKVARDCPDDTSMQRVMARVRARVGPFTAQDIIDAGNSLSLGYAAAAVLEALRANRRLENPDLPPARNDDYTITVGELRAALKHAPYWANPARNIDAAVDWIARYIRDHREPDWKAGDVVKDADGKFWKRTFGGKTHAWASFDSTLYSSFDRPRRPLEKMS